MSSKSRRIRNQVAPQCGAFRPNNITNRIYESECKRREVGGQKKPNFVNVFCERPLTITNIQNFTLNLSFDVKMT